jgi:hypothetical protein
VNPDLLNQIPGANDVVGWFGDFPVFHDADILEFRLGGEGRGLLKLKAFEMTDQVDEKGYFVCKKHCLVTFRLEEVTSVELSDFMPGQVIIFALRIDKDDAEEFILQIESARGFGGALRMKGLSVTLEPFAEPEPPEVEIERLDGGYLRLSLRPDKARALFNCFNEVCHGLKIDEFEKWIGATKGDTQSLMSRLRTAFFGEGVSDVAYTITLSELEMRIVRNTIYEVCNRIRLWEFGTRLGIQLDDGLRMLRTIEAGI